MLIAVIDQCSVIHLVAILSLVIKAVLEQESIV